MSLMPNEVRNAFGQLTNIPCVNPNHFKGVNSSKNVVSKSNVYVTYLGVCYFTDTPVLKAFKEIVH